MDMQTVLVGIVEIIVVCFVGAVIEIAFKAWQRRRKQLLARIAEDNEIREKLAKKMANWQQKVAAASHLLTGQDWRDPAGKTEFVQAVYGEAVPEYLWFALDDGVAEDQAWDDVVALFWGEGNRPQPGDLELHRSGNKEIGLALRVRFPKNFAPEFCLGDKVCPLYQTGYSYFGSPTAGCVNLVEIYEAKTGQPV